MDVTQGANADSADPQKELIEPALKGTTGLLKAVKKNAPSVKRIVITSSFASIVDEATSSDPATVYTEASWNPSGLADIHKSQSMAYRVSKTLAERSAWDFVAAEKPNFDLATVCPPLVFGPVVNHLATLESINTSNAGVVSLLQGKWKDEMPPTNPAQFYVDVRDVAKAHILALEKPEAGGQRLFVAAGPFYYRAIADILLDQFPEFKDKLPGPETKGGELRSASATYNNDKTVELLGLEFTKLEKSIADLVESLKAHGI